MKAQHRSVLILAIALIVSLPAHADDLEIGGFGQNGSLSWTNSVSNGTYTVEWASRLNGNWQDSWTAVTEVPATGGTITASVPMFYRVRRNRERIAFVNWPMNNKDLWIVYTDGTDKRLIKSGGDRLGWCEMSPDEDFVLYTEFNGSTFALKRYDIASNSTATVISPVWDFFALDHTEPDHVFYVGADTQSIYRLKLDGSTNSLLVEVDDPYSVTVLHLTPSGSHLITQEDDSGTGVERIMCYWSTGGVCRVLSPAQLSDGPSPLLLSPDSTRVFYARTYASQKYGNIIHIEDDVTYELNDMINDLWLPAGPPPLTWSPYADLVALSTNEFRSPITGKRTGTYESPRGPVEGQSCFSLIKPFYFVNTNLTVIDQVRE